MNFGNAIRSGFQQFAGFDGRASRSEFWYWYLFTLLLGLAILTPLVIAGVSDDGIDAVAALYTVALLVPGIAMAVRRLHDAGKPGWVLLVAFIPFGTLYILYLYTRPSDDPNDYGRGPLSGADL